MSTYGHDNFQYDLVMLSNGAALTMHKDPEAIQRSVRMRKYEESLTARIEVLEARIERLQRDLRDADRELTV